MLPKLETAGKKEAKERRTKIIFSLIMVFILMMSVISFALFYYKQPEEGRMHYNNHNFVYENEGWKTSIKTSAGSYYLFTNYLPQDVENISSSGNILNSNDFQSIVYFVSKSESERNAAGEIDKNLLAQKKEIACLPEYADETACINTTIRSCENANYMQKIIVFKETEENSTASIEYKNNCVTIKGSEYDLIKAADKIIYLLFDIIKQEEKEK